MVFSSPNIPNMWEMASDYIWNSPVPDSHRKIVGEINELDKYRGNCCRKVKSRNKVQEPADFIIGNGYFVTESREYFQVMTVSLRYSWTLSFLSNCHICSAWDGPSAVGPGVLRVKSPGLKGSLRITHTKGSLLLPSFNGSPFNYWCFLGLFHGYSKSSFICRQMPLRYCKVCYLFSLLWGRGITKKS